MKKFSLQEFELCVQRIYYKEILEQDYSGILPKLNNILKRCSPPYKDVIEETFCNYVIYKTATDVFHKSSLRFRSADEIISMIIFKQSSDEDINLLAKIKCYKYGRINDGRKDFLKWQIDRLLLNNNFNMLYEYKKYKKECDVEDYSIPNMIVRTF